MCVGRTSTIILIDGFTCYMTVGKHARRTGIGAGDFCFNYGNEEVVEKIERLLYD